MEASFAKMLKFNKEFPDSKEVYRHQQAWYLKHKPANGLFCPSNMIFEFSPTVKQAMQYAHTMQHDYLRIREMLRQINFQEMLWGSHIFGSWRNTLSIYELDRDITDSVVKSPIPDDTPISIFKRLPEWCLFLKYPEKSVKAAHLLDTGEVVEAYFDGFWANVDQLYDVKTKTHEQSAVALHLTPNLVDENNNSLGSLHPIVLFMEDGLTVEQAINNAYDFYKDMADDFRGADKNDAEYNHQMELFRNKDYEIAVGMLSALLWLCAEEPDISNITGEPVSRSELQAPKHTVHPKTKNFITPSMPTVYSIGKRLGGEIRQMNDAIEHDKATNRGKGKRPHIRRGHWHGYWRGTGQAKEFFVKWQPAVFVNAR